MKQSESQRALAYIRKHMDIGNPRKIESKGIDEAITEFNMAVGTAYSIAFSALLPYKKAECLEKMGCEIIDVRQNIIDFKYEDYDYMVDSELFTTTDNIKYILDWAEITSPCCG